MYPQLSEGIHGCLAPRLFDTFYTGSPLEPSQDPSCGTNCPGGNIIGVDDSELVCSSFLFVEQHSMNLSQFISIASNEVCATAISFF